MVSMFTLWLLDKLGQRNSERSIQSELRTVSADVVSELIVVNWGSSQCLMISRTDDSTILQHDYIDWHGPEQGYYYHLTGLLQDPLLWWLYSVASSPTCLLERSRWHCSPLGVWQGSWQSSCNKTIVNPAQLHHQAHGSWPRCWSRTSPPPPGRRCLRSSVVV